ncbi:MAG: HDOD domain-containing protein [Deltaproteobacteria bacterium]|nr:MAG: HDOD domain-containing protein [Deltaproteobacteria bacterium]
MVKEQLIEWLKSGKDMPVLSCTATKVMKMAVDGASAQELAKVILESPALTAKVLRLVNSPFYGLSQKVSTIQHAIALLGFKMVCNLVLSISIVEAFALKKKGRFDHKRFCRDAFCSAVAADMIARECGCQEPEEVFVLGLLHDIGVLVMATYQPDLFDTVLERKEASGQPMKAIEQEIMGIDHTELGEIIAEQWCLPPAIRLTIRYHHDPDRVVSEHIHAQKLCRIIYLSDIMLEIFRGEDGHRTAQFSREARRFFKFTQDQINSLLNSFVTRVKDLADVFEINTADIRDYYQILQEANTKLGKINIEYDVLVKKLHQEQEKLAVESARVQESEEKYRQLFENASDAIAILDSNEKLLEVNKKFYEMSGYNREEITALSLQNLFSAHDVDKFLKSLGLLKKQGALLKPLNLVAVTKEGKEQDIEVKLSCLCKDGSRTSFQAIIRDVTHRKKEEEIRIQQEKLKAVIEMAGAAAHELAQPMTALLGITELLMLKIAPEYPNYQTIDTIYKQVHKMAETTQKISRITRYIIKEFPGGIKIVDINEASKPSLLNDSNPKTSFN